MRSNKSLSRASRDETLKERSCFTRKSEISKQILFRLMIIYLFVVKVEDMDSGIFLISLRIGIFLVSLLIFSETAENMSLIWPIFSI